MRETSVEEIAQFHYKKMAKRAKSMRFTVEDPLTEYPLFLN